jgi:methanogenic corrinoid protein MtbC1
VIRWCAYCQTFQGEAPPLDSYELTHGLCDACEKGSKVTDDEAIAAVRPVASFYGRLRAQAKAGFDTSGRELVEEAGALGIRPVDLLIGLLQPALYEIGQGWERGEVSVATEHRFTAAVESAAAMALARLPESAGARTARSPDFLLVNADGNDHTLGLKLVELLLLSGGRSTFTVLPGLPSPEVAELVRMVKPRILGVSIALERHASAVREIVTALESVSPGARPRVFVGGHCVKMGLTFDPALRVETCPDVLRLASMVGGE